MTTIIESLSRRPQHVGFVASLVYAEFWAEVPEGMTEAELAEGCRRSTLSELTAWTQWADRSRRPSP